MAYYIILSYLLYRCSQSFINFLSAPSLDPSTVNCYRSAPDCVLNCDRPVYGAWTHETTPLSPAVRYLIAGRLLFVESLVGEQVERAQRYAGRTPYGGRSGHPLRHVSGEARGGGPGLRPARHGQRPRTLAATGDAHGRNAAARRREPQSTPCHTQLFSGAGPWIPAAWHAEGRPFRRGTAGQRSQRNHEPARRLPAGNPPVGHGGDLRQSAGRQGPRHCPGTGPRRSFGHRKSQQRAVGPRCRVGRRCCSRVALGPCSSGASKRRT